MSDHTPEKTCWSNMKARCLNSRHPSYPNYGGRGITICERWLESFEAFLSDMGKRPSAKHSIERRDNNACYSPENCFWATRKEQQRNRNCNIYITHNGQRACLTEWCEKYRINVCTVKHRLKAGWSVPDAFTVPTRTRGRTAIAMLTAFGETLSRKEWAKRSGIPPETLRARLRKGWPLETALTTAVDTKSSKKRNNRHLLPMSTEFSDAPKD